MDVNSFNVVGELSSLRHAFLSWRPSHSSHEDDRLTHNFAVDPFAEETGIGVNDKDVGSQQNIIHIRTQQRNGKKSLTTLQGLPSGQHRL